MGAAVHNGFGWVTDGASNLGELRTQLHAVMLRRTKDAVLDLPPKLRIWLPVTVPEGTGRRETRRVLETLIAGALGRARQPARTQGSSNADEVGDDVAPAADKKKRASARVNGRTSDPSAKERAGLLAAITKARVAIARAKILTTLEFVEGVVEQGEKVIVFSAFDEPVQRIAAHFGGAAVVLTGATPAGARQALVDRFQTDDTVRVFVANIVAGGVGITLTAATQVVFNDLDWVPANHWQAEDRAYRIGQTRAVNVTYMTADGTVDEFVSHALRAKAALVDVVVEGTVDAMQVGDGDMLAELERLVATLSPGIATLADTESGEDPVDRLLREATAAVAARSADSVAGGAHADVRRLPDEAIRALARVLAGPAPQRWQVASSDGKGHYLLDAEGGDVTCTCLGFEYRGACRHARMLTELLASGTEIPAEFQPVES